MTPLSLPPPVFLHSFTEPQAHQFSPHKGTPIGISEVLGAKPHSSHVTVVFPTADSDSETLTPGNSSVRVPERPSNWQWQGHPPSMEFLGRREGLDVQMCSIGTKHPGSFHERKQPGVLRVKSRLSQWLHLSERQACQPNSSMTAESLRRQTANIK